MDQKTEKTPWYVAGLAFECAQCGRCCAGPEEGYVWASEDEIRLAAEYLGITVEQMHKQYVRKIGRRYSFREVSKTNDCIFLTERADGKGKGCLIYPVRPTQCRTWPFWASNISDTDAWAQAGMRCIGINRGKIVPLKKIEALADSTTE